MNRNLKLICLLCIVFISIPLLTGCIPDPVDDEKPVIYLYPESEKVIEVKLDYEGTIKYTYPQYIEGWRVKATPEGTLTNMEDNKEYSYLFWEGVSHAKWNLDRGFVIKGKDTADFLQETLSKMGLLPKEYNEFIVYWLPRIQNNKYNLIYFAGEDYTKRARLKISPKPDSILRVFMIVKSLDKYINIKKQEIRPFERKGFTVIEWGGTEIK